MKKISTLILILMSLNINSQETNYKFSHTDSTTVKSDVIWKIWTDVSNWKNWDSGLKDATLNGEFKIGNKGKIISQKGPNSKFIITKVNEGISYQFKSKIPFGWLIITRTMENKNGLTFFTHEVEFTGVLKKFFGKQLGIKFKSMLPGVLTKIKEIAEQT